YVSMPDLDLEIFYFIILFFSQLKLVFLMKMLKKFYVNSDLEFDPLSLPHYRNANTLKLYEDELRELKENLAEKSKILRFEIF
ncbi:hypothetical protein J1N35_034951, partial [Gossypium stocksii]